MEKVKVFKAQGDYKLETEVNAFLKEMGDTIRITRVLQTQAQFTHVNDVCITVWYEEVAQ